MAYSANKHDVFSGRMKNWFNSLQNLRDELGRLDEIYTHEAASGDDDAFTDTDIATKAEHVAGIVFMRALVDFVENGVVSQADRTSNITPFAQ